MPDETTLYALFVKGKPRDEGERIFWWLLGWLGLQGWETFQTHVRMDSPSSIRAIWWLRRNGRE